MCIYKGENTNLTYKSEEHIFPATIGGIEKLPKGYVSDEVNNYFSKMESQMVTQSFVGLEKMFWGPGRRGSNKPGRMPITLFVSDNKENLGFSFEGKPYYITQIIINKDLKQISIGRDCTLQSNADIEKLINKLKKFEHKYTLISNKPTLSAFLIGLYENRIYIAVNDENKITQYIEFINKYIKGKIDYNNAKYSKSEQPQVLLNLSVDAENDARVYAKVALNVLAKLKDYNYLMNPCFNEIKNWIMGERNEKFQQIPKDSKL